LPVFLFNSTEIGSICPHSINQIRRKREREKEREREREREKERERESEIKEREREREREKERDREMKHYCFIICTSFLFIITQATYPQTTLQCMASLTKPDKKLICPEQRNNYCLKEVTDLKSDLCGKTQYFGDYWDEKLGLCYFKKCSESCNEGDSTFLFGGKSYTRTQYCCNDKNYCNSGSKFSKDLYTFSIFCISLVMILMSMI
jgi:hypothetical protein